MSGSITPFSQNPSFSKVLPSPMLIICHYRFKGFFWSMFWRMILGPKTIFSALFFANPSNHQRVNAFRWSKSRSSKGSKRVASFAPGFESHQLGLETNGMRTATAIPPQEAPSGCPDSHSSVTSKPLRTSGCYDMTSWQEFLPQVKGHPRTWSGSWLEHDQP